MSRIDQLLGCIAVVSAVALAPAAMAKGGPGAAAASGSAANAIHSSASAGPRVDPLVSRATPTRLATYSLVRLSPHLDPAYGPNAVAVSPMRDPHMFPLPSVQRKMVHAGPTELMYRPR